MSVKNVVKLILVAAKVRLVLRSNPGPPARNHHLPSIKSQTKQLDVTA